MDRKFCRPSISKVLRDITSTLINLKRAREAYEASSAAEDAALKPSRSKKSRHAISSDAAEGYSSAATEAVVSESSLEEVSTTTVSTSNFSTRAVTNANAPESSIARVSEPSSSNPCAAVATLYNETNGGFYANREGNEEVNDATTEGDSISTPRPTTLPLRNRGSELSCPAVFEGATIQVEPMSAFAGSQSEESVAPTATAPNSQSTVSEEWGPVSPARSYTSTGTGPLWSPNYRETEGDTPSSTRLRRVVEIAPHRYRYVGSQPVAAWFADCFESDGYDSEAIAQIATPLSTPPRINHEVVVDTSPPPSALSSSPGFIITGDTKLQSARDEWKPDIWPEEVEFLSS
ncbi:hypothetical protein DVH05_028665 [Phytophthora capsici]|nr:hypothetical protein DVH05_028665 [Phytophthora capsici]